MVVFCLSAGTLAIGPRRRLSVFLRISPRLAKIFEMRGKIRIYPAFRDL
ncbi:hypothetical protein C84B14_10672 [Salinisphaera sp. C84B14]